MASYYDIKSDGIRGLVDQDLFNQFLETKVDTTEHIMYNYCPDCNLPMILSLSEYQCAQCGLTYKNEIDGVKNHDDTVNSSIRITTGANKGHFYNTNGDYTKTQRKNVIEYLLQRARAYEGPVFSPAILNAAANQYNYIQKYITEDEYDEMGVKTGTKKFVRRSSIRDEILAGLIYFEGIRAKTIRKKKDIALFMGLLTSGFARGEDKLRDLEAQGKIDIPVDEEPIEGYVDRYLEALNIVNDNYSAFITEIVNTAIECKLGIRCQLSSKIVGSIWILITKCKLNISVQTLEAAADNTKKNTFMKFYKIVFDNFATFAPIFAKYKVPK